MFSLQDIDDQITTFNFVADDLYEKAEAQTHEVVQAMWRCHADGLRQVTRSLELMIERSIEAEAREALR